MASDAFGIRWGDSVKKTYCIFAAAIFLAIGGSLYGGKVVRAATHAIRFVRESAPGTLPANGTAYSAVFGGTIISGRVDKLVIGTAKHDGHTYTGIIIGVRSDQGSIKIGHGVSHFVVPAGAAIPPALLERPR
jgi:hypothetical protein